MSVVSFPFNIAFIGPVSAGKSTFLNAILSDTYSDMRLRRTTMSPQVYGESAIVNLTPAQIRGQNAAINSQVMSQRDQGAKIALTETHYDIRPISNFLPIRQGLHIRLYDIPGLNDQESEIYFEYLRSNIQKFDLIFLVFDIRSGLNRTDELGVLKTVLQQMGQTAAHLAIVANNR